MTLPHPDPRSTPLLLLATTCLCAVSFLSGCDDGALECPSSRPKLCGSACVDLEGDSRNCGACGNACAEGELCSEGTCGVGPEAALIAACFNSRELVSLDGALRRRGANGSSGAGPQSLALHGNTLLVASTLDNALYSFDSASAPPARTGAGGDKLGQAVNQLLVKGDRAYALNSLDNSVQVLELTRPVPTAIGNERTIDEVATLFNGKSEKSNPTFGAFIGEHLFVSLLGPYPADATEGNALIELDFSGSAGKVVRQLAFTTEGMKADAETATVPAPAGIAADGSRLFVALGNLSSADFSPPGGPGYLAVVETSGGELQLTAKLELPAACRNASFVLRHERRIYVSCLGSYGYGGEAIVTLDADALQVLNTTILQPCGEEEMDCLPATPGRMTYSRGRIVVADSTAGRLFALDLEGKVFPGFEKGVTICEPTCGDGYCFAMTSDVLSVEP